MMTRWAVFIALTRLAVAQAGGDAASLVRDVSTAAMSATSWRAEGSVVRRGADGRVQAPVRFRIAFQPPRYARLEISGADATLLRICDGGAQRTYYPDLKGFVRVALPQIGPCAFPINAWPPLAATLARPTLAGTDTLRVEGRPTACQIVRSPFTWAGRDPAVKETVTLWIDRTQHRILRYQMEHSAPGPATSETYTFSSLEMNAELKASAFDFEAPAGSHAFATIDWLSPISGLAEGVAQVSDAVSAPVLTKVMPPVAPPEAAMVEGGNTVALHVQIGIDGVVEAVEVSRSLGPGMDEAAVAAVKHWRFTPGMSVSGPVTVAGTVLVHFMDPVRK